MTVNRVWFVKLTRFPCKSEQWIILPVGNCLIVANGLFLLWFMAWLLYLYYLNVSHSQITPSSLNSYTFPQCANGQTFFLARRTNCCKALHDGVCCHLKAPTMTNAVQAADVDNRVSVWVVLDEALLFYFCQWLVTQIDMCSLTHASQNRGNITQYYRIGSVQKLSNCKYEYMAFMMHEYK